MTEANKDLHLQIVFFDGVCHLCNGFVDFVIQNETQKSKLIFAPLQGETAAKYLSETDRKSLESVIFFQQGEVHRESEAILRILKEMKAPWKLIAGFAGIFPRPFCDGIYRLLARHRYQWFGKRESCRLPLPEEKSQLWP